ncbi:MAG: rRNA maturation RNase YbeY [Parcubacteria group bacterium]|nr:rRNA maturation RNase YbeY [Parcubacteria group bacterium]
MRAKNAFSTISITNKTNGRLPRLPFSDIKNTVLGKQYNLSIVFIKNALSKNLNKRYRKKNNPANVLSFPLETHMGELFIDIEEARWEAHTNKRMLKNQILYLFIHGLFHLKGYRHNSTMEDKEARVRKKFSVVI